MSTKLFLIFSSDILPKYECMTSMIFSKNSKTIAALTFCLVTAASQMFARCIQPNTQTKSNQLLLKYCEEDINDAEPHGYQCALVHAMCGHTLMWKKLVRAIFVTGDRTCCRAWMTFTRNASTAFRPMSSRYTRDISTSPL